MLFRAVFVVGIVFVVACKKSKSESEETGDAFVTPTSAQLAAGRKLATVPSLPRKDWPTGTVEYSRSDSSVRSRGTFTYGSDEPCTLPVMAHEDGIVGCPTAYESGTYKKVYKYDAKRRFLDADSSGDPIYTWVDDGVEKLYVQSVSSIARKEANLATLSVEGKSYHRFYRVENGRLMASYRNTDPLATLAWGATRLESKEEKSTKTYFEYADTPVAKRPEDVEREKREAADHDAAALATATALPRAMWPCKAVTKFGDGDGRIVTFVYDDRATCKIPLELHAEGVVGCPKSAKLQDTKADGTTPDPETREFKYDGDVMVAGIIGARKRDDGLIAGYGTFERTDTGVIDRADKMTIDYTIVDGRATKIVSSASGMGGSLDLTWEKGRLVKVDGDILGTKREITMHYDCK